MMFGLLRALARIRVTVAYAVILTGVSSVLVALGPRVQNRVISHASTNLHNLSHGHLGTLFVSAFVIEAGPIYVWLPGLMCLMALAELMWRSRRLVVAFAIGHIGATLLVAVGLTAAVELGWLSTDVTRATDVGMSYGASAVLGALSAAIPSRLRPAWIGWWIAVAAAVVAVNRDFTDVGHGMALVLGVLASTRFGHAARWTPTPIGMPTDRTARTPSSSGTVGKAIRTTTRAASQPARPSTTVKTERSSTLAGRLIRPRFRLRRHSSSSDRAAITGRP